MKAAIPRAHGVRDTRPARAGEVLRTDCATRAGSRNAVPRNAVPNAPRTTDASTATGDTTEARDVAPGAEHGAQAPQQAPRQPVATRWNDGAGNRAQVAGVEPRRGYSFSRSAGQGPR